VRICFFFSSGQVAKRKASKVAGSVTVVDLGMGDSRPSYPSNPVRGGFPLAVIRLDFWVHLLAFSIKAIPDPAAPEAIQVGTFSLPVLSAQ
jgi:hypothetical protein